ncbi:MAG: hypothetical protein JO345_08300 [Streptosporangiaceae bacterium]|nr:hypothetical protein [Streptosporangiaceae bacterium]
MSIPDDRAVTVPALRQTLGLPAERPDGIRDLLAVPRERGAPVPDVSADPWRLALGDWPETWRADPRTGPLYLVMLRGFAAPYLIATVEDIDPKRWGTEADADPARCVVPVRGTAFAATAILAGCRLDAEVMFGWEQPEEQYAFL